MSGPVYIIDAFAKVNLRLKVLRRNQNDYHQLSMLNSLIDLSDKLQLEIELDQPQQVEVELSNPTGAAWEKDIQKNIAAQAAIEFLTYFAIDARVKIVIEKNIPSGAGLGGGSSDAAAVLQCLHRNFSKKLSHPGVSNEIAKIGLRLGADVPYFFNQTPAIVTGIGEITERVVLECINRRTFLLIIPDFSLNTATVFSKYRQLNPDLQNKNSESAAANSVLANNPDYQLLLTFCENDLEEAACACAPKLCELINLAREFKDFITVLTGSGSAFCMLPKENLNTETLNDIQSRFSELGAKVKPTQFLST